MRAKLIKACALAAMLLCGVPSKAQQEGGQSPSTTFVAKMPDDATKKAILAVISASLRDPISATYGAAHMYKNGVCVTVNAKNGFGGYVGEREAYLVRDSDESQWKIVGLAPVSHMDCLKMLYE